MLSSLPIELQVQILSSTAGNSLRATSSHFYLLYNDLYYNKLISEFGEDVIFTIQKVYPWLRKYIKSLDVFRKVNREIVSSRLHLKDHFYDLPQSQSAPEMAQETPHLEFALVLELNDAMVSTRLRLQLRLQLRGSEDSVDSVKSVSSVDSAANAIINSLYIKDSWKYIYALFKNKRLFAEYSDYRIDEPSNYIFNHYVEINRTYLLSYSKTVWLAPGKYNLNIGLVVKHGSGLGTTKFEINYKTPGGDPIVATFYPPTNINEILPKNQFCFLRVAEFEIPSISITPSSKKSSYHHQQLYKVQIIMEEIGLYLKSGFSIFFIDISQPSMLLNEYDLLYYSCKDTDYRKYINIPLKNFYKVLSYVQNLGVDDFEAETVYGAGNPKNITDSLETELNYDDDNSDTENIELDDALMAYAEFFFRNVNRRYFKFNTVYQRRQFINRFGNFDQELDESTENSCTYDPEGLKWRMPILGSL